jgi:hypothetical protein
MMECKTLEIRDRGTTLIVFAFKIFAETNRVRCLMSAAGYGRTVGEQSSYVFMSGNISGGTRKLHDDPFDWTDHTCSVAHNYIRNHWDEIADGAVVDVRVILGEAAQPVASDFNAEAY